MSLPQNFAATLLACENEQLYEMLAMKEDYLPEAIEAACTELRSRRGHILACERRREGRDCFAARNDEHFI